MEKPRLLWVIWQQFSVGYFHRINEKLGSRYIDNLSRRNFFDLRERFHINIFYILDMHGVKTELGSHRGSRALQQPEADGNKGFLQFFYPRRFLGQTFGLIIEIEKEHAPGNGEKARNDQKGSCSFHNNADSIIDGITMPYRFFWILAIFHAMFCILCSVFAGSPLTARDITATVEDRELEMPLDGRSSALKAAVKKRPARTICPC
jgi:hypothetical protein